MQGTLRVGQKTFALSQYLVDVLGIDDMGASYDGKATYHDSIGSPVKTMHLAQLLAG
jgi:L-lactate dehydrogenase complex protein LldE